MHNKTKAKYFGPLSHDLSKVKMFSKFKSGKKFKKIDDSGKLTIVIL